MTASGNGVPRVWPPRERCATRQTPRVRCATLGSDIQPLRGKDRAGRPVMPQSLVQIYVHLVFSTKNREPFLQDRVVREATHAYLGGTCRNLESPSITIGGVEDHVHVLLRLGKTRSISDLVRELKRES